MTDTACEVCKGKGEYMQTYTIGCGFGSYQSMGCCDYCEGTGKRKPKEPQPEARPIAAGGGDLPPLPDGDIWNRGPFEKPAAYSEQLMREYGAACVAAAAGAACKAALHEASNVDRAQQGEPVGEFYDKAFICKGCGGVYVGQAVTRCDCMPAVQEFEEGAIYRVHEFNDENFKIAP